MLHILEKALTEGIMVCEKAAEVRRQGVVVGLQCGERGGEGGLAVREGVVVGQQSRVVRLQAAQGRGDIIVVGGQCGVVRQEGDQVLRESLMIGLETGEGVSKALVVVGDIIVVVQQIAQAGLQALVVR